MDKSGYNLSAILKNQVKTDLEIKGLFGKFKNEVKSENIVGARVSLLGIFERMKANTDDVGKYFEEQVWPKAAESDYAYLNNMCNYEFPNA